MAKIFDSAASIYSAANAPRYTSSQAAPASTMGSILGQNDSQTNGSQGAPVNQVTLFSGFDGSVLGYPLPWIFIVAMFAVGVYYTIHKYGGDVKEFATPRIGLGSFFSIGVQALIFIVVLKVVLTKYRIPGLTEMVATA